MERGSAAPERPGGEGSILLVLSLCGFASAMSGRIVDPVVTSIAADLGVSVGAVALLSSAYTLPFALSQPVLGPLGDIFPKARLIKTAVLLLAGFLGLAALAPSLPLMFVTRILAGIAGAGLIPVGYALIGDIVPMAGRQLAISRFLAATLIGQLAGASGAGIVSDLLGWRGVFWAAAAVTGIIGLLALVRLTEAKIERGPIQLSTAIANYRSVLRNPLCYVCFSVVIVEGAIIYGWLPYLGDFLRSLGKGGPRQAGFVIAGLAIGGLVYSLAVPMLIRLVQRRQMMALGGVFGGLGLGLLSLGASWPIEAAFMGLAGFGFFLLHNPVQTEVSELAPAARASAFSLHAFSFYMGQALGPVLFGGGIGRFGLPVCLMISSVLFLLTGLSAWRLLRPGTVGRRIGRRTGGRA